MPVQRRRGPARIGLAFVIYGGIMAGAATAAEPAVEVDDLRPGLIASFRDGARPAPVEILRLEPIIALNLRAGESPHPRLAPDAGAYEWKGYLNVLRPGNYRFSAQLRGNLTLEIAGQKVLSADVSGDGAVLKEGPEVKLEAGVQPLTATFSRRSGAARVELFWKSNSFANEPLGYEQLGHLPKQVPARLAADEQSERGRFLVEERGCVKCHQPEANDKLAQGLHARPGPDLSKVGARVHPGWIYRWLENPQRMRAGAVMPRMFDDHDAGGVERYLAARYLASLGGPIKTGGKRPSVKDIRASEARGQQLFASLGCVACHGEEKGNERAQGRPRSFYQLSAPGGEQAAVPLTGLGSKTTPEKLALYLENPLAIDPSGRMPHMLLQGKETQDLARFLCRGRDADTDQTLPDAPAPEQILAAFQRVEKRPTELAAFQRLPEDKRQIELGKRLVLDKGCNGCHTIAPDGKPFAAVVARFTFEEIRKPEHFMNGCLADEANKRGGAPWFTLASADRQAVRRFLREGASGAVAPAPGYAARVTLQRFNCLACHTRDGEGGLTAAVLDELRKFEKAENAEAVSPPPLTGVGHKLRTPWLKGVLTGAGRARPWMGLRMPQFGEANVGHLAEGLAVLEGTEKDDRVHQVPLSSAKIEAGRKLIGKQAFGCISCHDIAGVANAGTRGPDLALMSQRVRYPWYRRWLEQAQRMQPGTRMPTVFTNGQSSLTEILGGGADAQAEAMWAYLSLGPGLPLPEGLEPPKGLILQVKDRPILLRTFMPDAGSRAVAVGYPKGVAVAFDAATCRLAYAWSGNFLDASPVWNNRGGAPAKVLGARFWTAPPGCPWAATTSNDPPDFTARQSDPAYGAASPEGKVYDGPRYLRFEGYSVDPDGLPSFRYLLSASEGKSLAVTEKPEPLPKALASGVSRRFDLAIPAQEKAWLWAGHANGEPRLLDASGETVKLDLKTGVAEMAAAGHNLVLPQGGARTLILTVADAPAGANWHLSRQGNGWQVLLRLPAHDKPVQLGFKLNVLAPYRDEPGLLKELIQGK